MIRLPYMVYSGSPSRKYNVSFGGLALTDRASEGELKDSLNIDTSRFPFISSRKAKCSGEAYYDPDNDKGVFSVWGDGETLALFEDTPDSVGDRIRFLTYGKSESDVWDLDAVWTWGEKKHDGIVRCGNYLVAFTDADTTNENKNVAPMYFNKGSEIQYGWTSLNCSALGTGSFYGDTLTLTNYTVIGGLQGTVDFSVGDALVLSGCVDAPENNMTLSLSAVSEENNSLKLTFEGVEFSACTEAYIEVSRTAPQGIRFPVAVNNRIWCVTDSVICASALGDPKNWNRFLGISTDSYQVGVDSALDFTGSGVYDSTPIFFKENCLYRVYGTLPSNYTLQRLDVPGVMEGCSKSVCKINEALYYKGKTGIYRYSGGIPVCISEGLGDLSDYCGAVAGEDGRRYFISMGKGGEWVMLVYDTETGIWLREGNIRAYSFAKFGNVTYYLGEDLRLHSYAYDPDGGLVSEETDSFPWSVTLAPFNETVKERKVYSKLYLRMELGEGSFATVYVSRDGGSWTPVHTVKGGNSSPTVTVPIKPKRCDSFSVKIEGEGEVCIKTLVREYRTAGDR